MSSKNNKSGSEFGARALVNLHYIRCYSDKNHDSRITIDESKEYCLDNTDVKSWIDYYDDIHEDWTVYDADMDPVEFAKALESECVVKVRGVEEAMARAGSRGALEQRDRLTGRAVSSTEFGIRFVLLL